ncbi:MAG: hypothetical protein NVSMB27_34320 [Ktedonobacteraceae bacterium]
MTGRGLSASPLLDSFKATCGHLRRLNYCALERVEWLLLSIQTPFIHVALSIYSGERTYLARKRAIAG